MDGYTDEYGRRIDFVPMPKNRGWIGKRVCGRVHSCERCRACEAIHRKTRARKSR